MKPKVLIKKCETYDRLKILRQVSQGMDLLNFAPRGRVFVKPNVVFANDPDTFGSTAFTHPRLLGASVLALGAKNGTDQIDIGENAAIGVPTRLCYKYAGYYQETALVQKAATCPVDIFCIDEDMRKSVFVGGKVHDNLRISRTMSKADTLVYLPKLKCHCVSKMTGAVKLNIGICSDDERAIRHDFLLNEKIVDLLAVGYPDFIVMDAIDVGMGNEAFPTPRKLGLILMGTNPMAIDLVGSQLLGLDMEDVPYLKAAADRGYGPTRLLDIELVGDITGPDQLDRHAMRLKPYDEEFFRWQDIRTELKRLKSPLRFYWGPHHGGKKEKCETGCVMGLKMYLGSLERFAGPDSFARAKPAVFVIGRVEEPIDAKGAEVFFLGSCAKAQVSNAGKTTRIDKCFTTAADMNISMGNRLGIPSMVRDPASMKELLGSTASVLARKTANGRYIQDMGHFITKHLIRRI